MASYYRTSLFAWGTILGQVMCSNSTSAHVVLVSSVVLRTEASAQWQDPPSQYSIHFHTVWSACRAWDLLQLNTLNHFAHEAVSLALGLALYFDLWIVFVRQNGIGREEGHKSVTWGLKLISILLSASNPSSLRKDWFWDNLMVGEMFEVGVSPHLMLNF